MSTTEEPDWHVVGKHRSGALLVSRRPDGTPTLWKCCPRCFEPTGPLKSAMVQVGDVLYCYECGGYLRHRQRITDEKVQLVTGPRRAKWHIEVEPGERPAPLCNRSISAKGARSAKWGSVKAEDICSACLALAAERWSDVGSGLQQTGGKSARRGA